MSRRLSTDDNSTSVIDIEPRWFGVRIVGGQREAELQSCRAHSPVVSPRKNGAIDQMRYVGRRQRDGDHIEAVRTSNEHRQRRHEPPRRLRLRRTAEHHRQVQHAEFHLRPDLRSQVTADVRIPRAPPPFPREITRGVTYSFSFRLPSTDQESVYRSCVADVTLSVLEGYNGSIIAYGQTGTGKTYTIEGAGDAETRGIIPRATEEIFKCM